MTLPWKHSLIGGLVVGVATAILTSGSPARAASAARTSTVLSASSPGPTGPITTLTPVVPASELAAAPTVDSRELERGDVAWRAAHAIPSIWPVAGRISSIYTPHRMHPILGRYAPHYGLDLAAPYGTPIHVTADGVVIAVVNSPSYGLGVDVRHADGYITRYAHASKLLVVVGESVHQGDVIAYVGSTGLSTGPHCHYEIFHNGWSVDPATMLRTQ